MRKERFLGVLQYMQVKMQCTKAFCQSWNVKNSLSSASGKLKKYMSGLSRINHVAARTAVAAAVCDLTHLNHLIAAGKRVKYMALSVVLALALITSTSVYAYIGSFTYVVYLDGEEAGFVADETVVKEYLAALQQEEEFARNADVAAIGEVKVVREQRKGSQEDEGALKAYLKQHLQFKQYAYTIMINGRAILNVGSIAEYEKVLESLKSAYISGNDNAVVQAIVLNDQLEARLTLVEPHEIYSVEEASELLRHGSNKRQVYLVSRGDSLWSIANSNHVSIADIMNANPHLGGSDRLMPGDEINLVVSEPLVTVSVTEDVTKTERIPFETHYKDDKSLYKGQTKVLQAGQFGLKEVTYRITKQNGREASRQILAEDIQKDPQVKIVARGTKAVPAGAIIGTGRFAWPVAGRGNISSRYGYRGRSFHRGVDIATPVGTPILAADSGTVIQTGWAGSYGILVTINHGNGYVTKYAHNSASLVSVGQKVQRGQQIARSGNTGNSTGPHLHFEVIKNGATVNPLSYL